VFNPQPHEQERRDPVTLAILWLVAIVLLFLDERTLLQKWQARFVEQRQLAGTD